MSNPLDVEHVITHIKSKTGRIDALIDNAGFSITAEIEDTSLEETRAQMATNFFGVCNMCHAIAPVMREQGAGHIITISRLAALVGMHFSGLYSVSKAAVEALTESLRFELYRYGVRVAFTDPGDIDTNLPASRRYVARANADSAYAEAFVRFQKAQAEVL